MAQPPLSRAIRALEDELGVVLFDRTSRAVSLTEAGRVLTEHARDVLASVDLAVAETRRSGGAGVALRVGFTPHLPMEQLLRLLGALHEREASLEVQVRHAFTVEQLRSLRRGELDIGIVPWPAPEEGLEFEPLFPGEPLVAFLAAGHPLTEKDVLGPDDLDSEVRISYPRELNPVLIDWIRAQMDRAGYRFRAVQELSGTDPRDWVMTVADGSGVALLPDGFEDLAGAGAVVARRPLDPPVELPETVVAWRAGPPARLRAQIATVRELAGELRRGGVGRPRGA